MPDKPTELQQGTVNPSKDLHSNKCTCALWDESSSAHLFASPLAMKRELDIKYV